ncbi:MAG: hypothetical protein B7Y77_01660 [Bradyrhizobium sp. 35-63-5]|nr:MAG: hypothetical protein B7Y77_01660 [Bradyrhizobium sp. 35-63-5]
MTYNPDLPRHAADKASRAIYDVIDLTDDLDEKFQIALMACSAPIGIAGAIIAAKMEREGRAFTQAEACSTAIDLLKTLVESGPQAAIEIFSKVGAAPR